MMPREDGRSVRQTNSDNLMPDLSKAEDVLLNALVEAAGDSDELIIRIGMALRHIKKAKWASLEIEELCEKSAKRGTYKKVRSNGDE